MSSAEFELIDLSGVVRFKGTAEPPFGPGAPPTLADVLAAGNDADGVQVTNPAPLYAAPDLAAVLAAGNDAGGVQITNPAPLYSAPTPDLAAVLAVGNDAGGVQITNPAPLYSAPAPLQAAYAGNVVSIGNTVEAALTWDAQLSGDDLLDLTNPANPTAKVAGLYTVTATIHCDGLTASGYYRGTLNLLADAGAQQHLARNTSSPIPAGPYVAICVAAILDVGNVVSVLVRNSDGAVSRDFRLEPVAVTVTPIV